MNYSIINIPEPLQKPFFEMNKKDAQKYLEWFLDEREVRLSILDKAIRSDDLKNWELNYSAKSLIPLFRWFKSSITKRKKTKEDILDEKSKITGLLKNHVEIEDITLSEKSVSICSDVALYFGEVLKKEKSLEWSFVLKPKNYVEYAQPIITKKGGMIDLNPRRIIENLASSIIEGENFDDDKLLKLYSIWKEDF